MNIITTGQSNAELFDAWQGDKLAADLGMVNATVDYTAFGGVSLLPVKNNIDGGNYPSYLAYDTSGQLVPGMYETLRNAALQQMHLTGKTVIVWMHNESDSTQSLFDPQHPMTTPVWEAAARYAINDIRTSLHLSVADTPVVFVTIPFQKSVPHDSGNKVIADGMANIMADGSMNAWRGPDVSGMAMDYLTPPGGAHMNPADAALLESRLAVTVARLVAPTPDVGWTHLDGSCGLLTSQLLNSGPTFLDSVAVDRSSGGTALAASHGNMLLVTGSGNDAIAAFGDNNVIDGGTGSNWLVGGGGANNTFFADLRANGVVWDTVGNFVAGNHATVWGFDAGVDTFRWQADNGASNGRGATIHIDRGNNGTIDASVTFAGLKMDQLVTSTGTQDAGTYLAVQFR